MHAKLFSMWWRRHFPKLAASLGIGLRVPWLSPSWYDMGSPAGFQNHNQLVHWSISQERESIVVFTVFQWYSSIINPSEKIVYDWGRNMTEAKVRSRDLRRHPSGFRFSIGPKVGSRAGGKTSRKAGRRSEPSGHLFSHVFSISWCSQTTNLNKSNIPEQMWYIDTWPWHGKCMELLLWVFFASPPSTSSTFCCSNFWKPIRLQSAF